MGEKVISSCITLVLLVSYSEPSYLVDTWSFHVIVWDESNNSLRVNGDLLHFLVHAMTFSRMIFYFDWNRHLLDFSSFYLGKYRMILTDSFFI